MPTKISSYLTEAGFRQLATLAETAMYNKETGGEFIIVKENNRLYRYEASSTSPVDNSNILNTADGGDTRWITVGGSATTQTRIQYTFETESNEIPLGMSVLSKNNILYVNINNTQILSSEFTLNADKNAILLSQSFKPGVATEVVIFTGDFSYTAGAVNYNNVEDKPKINGVTLVGDKSTADLGITASTDYTDLTNKPSINGVTLEGNKTTDDLDISGGALEVGDIGFSAFGIDETKNKRRYLNGQVIVQSQFTGFTSKLKTVSALYPNLITTETNWQAEVTTSKLGQCGKFVIDDTAGTIRLPKVVNINGLQSLANLGGIKTESLPNITGSINSAGTMGFVENTSWSGAFSQAGASRTYGPNAGSASTKDIKFDASLSSSVYQDSAPVQQEAVQYPYFIQVATGNEETVNTENELDLNNPFFFGMYQWFQIEPTNLSWLKSQDTYYSGTTYNGFYEWLLQKRNENIKPVYKWTNGSDYACTLTTTPQVNDRVYSYYPLINFGYITAKTDTTITVHNDYEGNDVIWTRDSSLDENKFVLDSQNVIVLTPDEITNPIWPSGYSHDSAYDYVINTVNTTFRLPLKVYGASGNAVSGNGMTLGLTDGSLNSGLVNLSGNTGQLGAYNNVYGTILPTPLNTSSTVPNTGSIGVTTDPTKSGIETSSDHLYLYFYVGETVQGANLINMESTLLDIANLKANTVSKSEYLTENEIQQQIFNRIYQGRDLTVVFANEIANYSDEWAWIHARIQANNYSGLYIGDYIPVTISAGTVNGKSVAAQTLQCQIAGINTYKNCGDVAIPSHIDFISREVITQEFTWNPSDSNNATSATPYPWLASGIYAILNGISNYTTSAQGNLAHGANCNGAGILQLLPAKLSNQIITKRNLLDQRYNASSALTYSTTWGWQDMGKLWLPNELEVYGTQIRSNLGYGQGYWNPEANIGVSYPIYINSGFSRVKFDTNGNRRSWWLSSCASYSAAYVCFVYRHGIAVSSVATYAGVCCPLCFRIA